MRASCFVSFLEHLMREASADCSSLTQRGMLATLAARLRARRMDGQGAEGELGEGEVLLDDDCRVSAAESLT